MRRRAPTDSIAMILLSADYLISDDRLYFISYLRYVQPNDCALIQYRLCDNDCSLLFFIATFAVNIIQQTFSFFSWGLKNIYFIPIYILLLYYYYFSRLLRFSIDNRSMVIFFSSYCVRLDGVFWLVATWYYKVYTRILYTCIYNIYISHLDK